MSSRPSLSFVVVTVALDVLGVGLLIPVLPALVGTLTTSPARQTWWFGALTVVYGLVQFLVAPFLGALSDRVGRRPVLLLSIFGLGVSYLVNGLTHSLPLMLALRVLSGATSASMSVATAYVADITTPEERGAGFGALGAAFGVGFVLGPALGGLLGASGLRLPFFVAAGLALLNWLYGFFVLPESLPPERRTPLVWRRANPLGALAFVARGSHVGGLVLVYVLTIFAQFVLQTGWVLYTSFRFHWTVRQNGLALFLVGVTAGLVEGLLFGKLVRRFGEQRLALLGMASAIVAYVGFGLLTQASLIYVLILVNALSFAIAPALQTLISRAADAKAQGITQGALQSMASLTMLAAPFVGSPVLAATARLAPEDWRAGSLFFVCAAVQTLAFVLAVRHFERRPSWALLADD